MTQTVPSPKAWSASNVSIVSSDWQGAAPLARAKVQTLETRELQQKLLHAVTTNLDKDTALVAVRLVVEAMLGPVWLMYFDRVESGRLDARLAPQEGQPPLPSAIPAAVLAACNVACEQGKQHTARVGEQGALIAAERVFLKGRQPEAVALVIPSGAYALESLSCVAQLVASHLTLWHILQTSSQHENESRVFAAVLELAGKLTCAHDLHGACLTAAGAVQSHLACQRVAIGLAADGSKRCRLQALSGVSKFDRNSELVRALEAALDESLLRDSLATWPNVGEAGGSTLALQRLCALTEATAAVSLPLRDDEGKGRGAWIVLGTDKSLARTDTLQFVRACATPLGSCLRLWQRAERGRLPRLVEKVLEHRQTWQAKAILAAVLLLAGVLALPMPYKISANCKLQPVMRRFVAAPFDGLLEKSLVSPGDLVEAGDVLARLDGREIRWELAGVTADYNRAAKQAVASRAIHNVAAAQQARLEMERLELKIRLLEDRARHLEVTSPLEGIVVSGDLEKTEGAPLSVGQTLFEIAPLDKMIVEVAVPEDDVAYVQSGAEARVQLDAYANQRWTGTVVRLHPRAEIRDERNVFVAEIEFDNVDGRLRPGLNGTAKIVGPRRPLAWNLFHKAWERVITFLGW